MAARLKPQPAAAPACRGNRCACCTRGFTRGFTRGCTHGCARGFTLIELIVVMAIVALLVSVAAPRYLASLERGRETALRSSLAVMRQAIDQFAADRGRYPASLNELVQARYLRKLPEDPMTHRLDSWLLLPPPADDLQLGGVWDVRSGAAGKALDGQPYADL